MFEQPRRRWKEALSLLRQSSPVNDCLCELLSVAGALGAVFYHLSEKTSFASWLSLLESTWKRLRIQILPAWSSRWYLAVHAFEISCRYASPPYQTIENLLRPLSIWKDLHYGRSPSLLYAIALVRNCFPKTKYRFLIPLLRSSLFHRVLRVLPPLDSDHTFLLKELLFTLSRRLGQRKFGGKEILISVTIKEPMLLSRLLPTKSISFFDRMLYQKCVLVDDEPMSHPEIGLYTGQLVVFHFNFAKLFTSTVQEYNKKVTDEVQNELKEQTDEVEVHEETTSFDLGISVEEELRSIAEEDEPNISPELEPDDVDTDEKDDNMDQQIDLDTAVTYDQSARSATQRAISLVPYFKQKIGTTSLSRYQVNELYAYEFLTVDLYHRPSFQIQHAVVDPFELPFSLRESIKKTLIQATRFMDQPILGSAYAFKNMITASSLIREPLIYLREIRFSHSRTGEKVIVELITPLDSLIRCRGLAPKTETEYKFSGFTLNNRKMNACLQFRRTITLRN